MPIDFHAHWVPRALSTALRARAVPPLLRMGDDGREVLECGFLSLPVPHGFDDIDVRLAEMDRQGITRGVLSLTTVYGVECLPIAESLPLCRAFNDAVAAACAAHPDRFSGLAALPLDDPALTFAEFERAMTLPGMIGALLPGDGFLSEKRAAQFRPLFAAAERMHAVFLVHYGRLANDPEVPKIDASDNGHVRYGTLDMQARLSSNMITFCFTDFLAAYPNVTVLSHNLGGNVPFELERMDHRTLIDRPGDELPSKRFRAARIMVDCNSFGAKGIELAVATLGADKIVLGTDGTEFGMKWSMDAIADARISDTDRAAILDGNAERALARVRAAPTALAA